MTSTGRAQRRRDDRGVALVEFAIVSVLLIMLLLGIIAFGYLLAFKQNVTQAAAEGARVGAVEAVLAPEVAAQNAVQEAVDSFGQTCNNGTGMTCTQTLHDCGQPVGTQTAAVPDCITVEVEYDYAGHPILPDFPLIAALLPDTINSSSTSQVNP